MNSLQVAFYFDLFVVAASALVLLRKGSLRHSHPAVIYLFFHLYTVSFRAWKVLGGAPTLFSEWGLSFQGVSHEEIARAVWMADIALVVMIIAWIAVPLLYTRVINRRGQLKGHTLELPHIWVVVLLAFPIGCAGLIYLANLPGSDETVALGDWQESSWLSITQTWPGLCLLALIFWYGFRWWLIAPMTLYLLIMSYQGYHRFRVVIPVILLVQIYLDRRGRKWPTLATLSVLVALGLVFFPLKAIGRMAQYGFSASDIIRNSAEIVETALSGEHDDQQFLDMMASTITLVDERGKFYWGEPYAALITLPIPRQWWKEKPTPADYMADFSTKQRPMQECGMIATIVGESYANFGYFGVVLVPLLLASLLGWMYASAYAGGYLTVARFGYLMLACNLIQVFRDGVVSMVIFTAVNMMPLTLILLLYKLVPPPAPHLPHPVAARPQVVLNRQ